MDSTTQKVLMYNSGAADLGPLITTIQKEIYEVLLNRWKLSLETTHDFLAGFLKRIPTLIQNFNWIGKPFGAYLYSTLKFYVKKYLNNKNFLNKKRIYFEVPLEDRPLEGEYVTQAVYSEVREKDDTQLTLAIRKNQTGVVTRRIIYLLLKAAWNVDDRILELTSEKTSVPVHDLFLLVEKAKEFLRPKAEKREKLYNIRGTCIAKIFQIQNLLQEGGDPGSIGKLQADENKWRFRMQRAENLLKRIKLVPSHSEIASILNISKSTIDSLAIAMKPYLPV